MRLERYLDAVPLSASEPEPVGRFTLFRPTGPWRYYARPRLGLDENINRADVDALRQRQIELKLPQNIEWVQQTTPSLMAAARESGLEVHEYPLLARDVRDMGAITAPHGVEIRQVEADDPDFTRAHAVANVGFGAPGTAVGPQGTKERDESAAATKPDADAFMRERHRAGLSVTYAAFDESGPIAVGTHQPVGEVTEIVGVATLPSARRRGIAAALTAALAADAVRRGVTTLFMGADSDDVARIYERAGFVRVGSAGGAAAPSLYDAAGGIEGLTRLAHAWHERVLGDPVVSHAFHGGAREDHSERLAAYWAEALGGPPIYSSGYAGESDVVRMHSGNGEHDEMNQRAIARFDEALVEAGLGHEPLRTLLHDYFAWATTTSMYRYHSSAADVPPGMTIPRWSWHGLVMAER
jgi:truncated hemoglobin YjbI